MKTSNTTNFNAALSFFSTNEQLKKRTHFKLPHLGSWYTGFWTRRKLNKRIKQAKQNQQNKL